ncbi:CHAT domain-containing protein [Mycolicibacterium sp. CBMA 226]|uniref:CHAT domain-containing protein n=1 Tax=Mycolicibacterium sp. CBMA 226 TaxID=2606611 RepID=UPI001315D3F2|nr:CHAT domain-containing protein [Mycolicibacterium sp. CBMA 226]QGW61093.1 hypothetical protein ICEMyc226_00061 [Mycolicibacterium sp.]
MANLQFLALGFATMGAAKRAVAAIAQAWPDDNFSGMQTMLVGPKTLHGSRDITTDHAAHELVDIRPAALVAGIMDAEPWRVPGIDSKWHVADWATTDLPIPEYNFVDSLTELSQVGSVVLVPVDTMPSSAEVGAWLSRSFAAPDVAEPAAITSLVLDQPATATLDSISGELAAITGLTYELQVGEGSDLTITAGDPPAAVVVAEGGGGGRVVRYVEGRYHRRVQVDQSFLIAVQICTDRPEGGATVAIDLPAGGTRVHAMLSPSPGMEVESEQNLELVVPPNRPTGWHAWEVRVKEEGHHQAVVCFHHCGEVLAALVFDVEAGEVLSPALTSAPQAIDLAPLTTTQGLLVVSSPGPGTMRFVGLDGQTAGVAVVDQASIDPAVLTAIRGRQRELLDRIARANYVGCSEFEDAEQVREVGIDLFDFLPKKIKEFLVDGLKDWQSLKIETDDDSLAWELLSQNQTGPKSYFANRVPFLRWRTGIGPPSPALAFTRPLLVQGDELAADRGDAASFEKQIQELQRRLNAGDDSVITDTATLTTRVQEGNFDLLHYAGHMASDKDRPSMCIGNNQYSVARIRTLAPAALTRRPLVFLNACATNTETPQLAGPSGWVKEFLSAGAGSYIGTNWRVRASTAERFAEHFYDALNRGEGLAAASFTARQNTLRQAEWASLAYTVYGHPEARVTPQAAPQST